MLPLASLLNPITSNPLISRLPSSPCSSNCASSSCYSTPAMTSRPLQKRQKMTKDGAVFAKGKIKGEVNFRPFENLDDDSLREVKKYQIYPLGKIEDYCRHIPYNSEKKSFLEKTGRESFEVFQYTFKVPGDDKEYTVMWDYNIGLVRITPFFKCCKYSKTTPAKMLNLNSGLKEITHSITGGALAAQGYWMPFSCAFAICATFCSHIAGALIPIFGPTFPSNCTPTNSPTYGRMIIDASIIVSATAEANSFRQLYASLSFPTPISMRLNSASASPREFAYDGHGQLPQRSTPQLRKRLRMNNAHTTETFYMDTDTSEMSGSSGDGYLCSPMTPESARPGGVGIWGASRMPSATSTPRTPLADSIEIGISTKKDDDVYGRSSPWLSAIPRSGPELGRWKAQGGRKRRAEGDAGDDEYDGEDSASGSGSESRGSEQDGVEKKAAWLLMKLSVRDGEASAAVGMVDDDKDRTMQLGFERSIVKRRRATSV